MLSKNIIEKKVNLIFKILLLLTSLSTLCYAQKQGNIWYFPRGIGLDFNQTPPAFLEDGQIDSNGGGTEGCASIATGDGKLLFYANGEQIWNRKHETMLNGDDLMGHFSSTNGALIVPMPGENSKYYVFTTYAFQESLSHGLRYSIIDMCGENGYGEVVNDSKNILLLSDAGEKLAFTKHANGIDYWLVAHRHFSTLFHAYRITEHGISPPVKSDIGTFHGRDGYQDAIGQMKISPNGDKLALVMENRAPDVIDLFDFNTSTGMLSGYMDLSDQSMSQGIYGVAFSPDQTKLYFSGRHGIFQLSLDAGNGSRNEIIQTKYKIANQVTTGGLQLGPDGKIYVVRFDYAAVIANPNLAGVASNFIDNAIYFGGRIVTFAFPSFLDSFDYPDKGPIPLEVNLTSQFSLCQSKTLLLDATSKGENVHYRWADNSTDPVYEVSSAGEYTVKISDRFCEVEKKMVVTSPFVVDLGPDQSWCKTDKVVLKSEIPDAQHQWQDGSTNVSFEVHHSGVYWVDVTKDNCTVRDSITVAFVDGPLFSLGNDTTLCEGQEFKLAIHVQADSIKWQDGSTGFEHVVKTAGHYTATVTLDGCSHMENINVSYIDFPRSDLGPDTVLCEGEVLALTVADENSTILWSDGSSANSLSIRESGIYWLDLSHQNCSVRDSIQVSFNACDLTMPNIFTPNGDEFNQNFIPIKMDGVLSGTLVIYNRWGQEIFQTVDLTRGWDGHGASDGVYYWDVSYVDVSRRLHRINGSVTIKR